MTDLDAMVRILTQPRNALVNQYRKFFDFEDCQLEFSKGALKLVAQRALERDTGARALRSVMEEFMLDAMYELPERPKSGKCLVTEAVVEGSRSLFAPKTSRRRESA